MDLPDLIGTSLPGLFVNTHHCQVHSHKSNTLKLKKKHKANQKIMVPIFVKLQKNSKKFKL